MADFSAQELAGTGDLAPVVAERPEILMSLEGSGSFGAGGPASLFKMRGRDDGRSPGSDYIIWTSSGTPDFAGAGFSSGTPTPLGSLIAGSVVQVSEL